MKVRTVIFSPEASNDLIALYDWIADVASPVVAMRYVERLEAHCLGMSNAGERGHKREDIRPGLRIVGFERRVTIAFTLSADRLTILRLFYAGQHWEETL